MPFLIWASRLLWSKFVLDTNASVYERGFFFFVNRRKYQGVGRYHLSGYSKTIVITILPFAKRKRETRVFSIYTQMAIWQW